MRTALIVGQGLAGTLLALELQHRGWQIRIVDKGHSSSSSIVAGGLWNPLSFRTHGLTWRAQECIQALSARYPEIEGELGVQCFHPKPLLRLFRSALEANQWDEKDPLSQANWLRPASDHQAPEFYHAPHGSTTISGTGWLDVQALLQGARKRWTEDGTLWETAFDESELLTSNEGIQYRDIRGDIVIWCTGWQVEGKAFGWLPIVPNKGEVLTVSGLEAPEKHIVNFGQFILPVGNGHFKVGSTFEVSASDPGPTRANKDFLLTRLEGVAPGHSVQVSQHQAGYRPTVPDRKPLVGPHPSESRWYCFTGFGARGVLTIPFLSAALADSLENRGSLPAEVLPRRYYKGHLQ